MIRPLRGTLFLTALVCAVDWGTKALHPVVNGWWIPHRVDRPVLLIGMTTVLVCLLLVLAIRSKLAIWASGLLMGGSIANLTDLSLHGMVWDMIPYPWDTDHLCNVADVAIASGMVLSICAVVVFLVQTNQEAKRITAAKNR